MRHGLAIYIRGFFNCPTRLLAVLLFAPLSAARSVAADDKSNTYGSVIMYH